MDFYCRNAPFQEMLQERAGGSEEIHDVLLARRGCAFEQSWERRRLRVLSLVDGGGTDLLSRPHGSNGGSPRRLHAESPGDAGRHHDAAWSAPSSFEGAAFEAGMRAEARYGSANDGRGGRRRRQIGDGPRGADGLLRKNALRRAKGAEPQSCAPPPGVSGEARYFHPASSRASASSGASTGQ